MIYEIFKSETLARKRIQEIDEFRKYPNKNGTVTYRRNPLANSKNTQFAVPIVEGIPDTEIEHIKVDILPENWYE